MCGDFKLLAIIVLLFFACQKKGDYSAIRIVGHAGMGLENEKSYYHDNSLEAIQMALTMDGCDGVEVDVQRASDGTIWLYHDDKLESQTDGDGCIPDKFGFELEQLNYNSINKEKIIKLTQLPWDRLKNKRLFLDIRHYNSCSSTFLNPEDIVQSINQAIPANIDFDKTVILNRRQWVNSFVSAGFQVFLHVYPDKEDPIKLANDFPSIEGVVMKNTSCSQGDVEFWRSKGKKVVIFEMRSPKGIRSAMEKYPDEVITDDLRTTIIEKF